MIGLMVTEEKVAEQQARLSCEEESKGIWLVHFICYWENVIQSMILAPSVWLSLIFF